MARANAVDCKRFFARGDAGLKRKRMEERHRQENFRVDAAKRVARAQTATKETGAAGRKRKAALPPEAYMYLLNPLMEAGGTAPKRQGTGYGNASLKPRKAARAKEKAMAKPPPSTKVPQPTKSGKRRTGRQLRQLAAERPLARLKRKRRQPKRAAAPRAEQLAAAGLGGDLEAAAREEEEELLRAETEAAEAEAAAARRREREADLQLLFKEQETQRVAEAAAAVVRAAKVEASRLAARDQAEWLRAKEKVELETCAPHNTAQQHNALAPQHTAPQLSTLHHTPRSLVLSLLCAGRPSNLGGGS